MENINNVNVLCNNSIDASILGQNLSQEQILALVKEKKMSEAEALFYITAKWQHKEGVGVFAGEKFNGPALSFWHARKTSWSRGLLEKACMWLGVSFGNPCLDGEGPVVLVGLPGAHTIVEGMSLVLPGFWDYLDILPITLGRLPESDVLYVEERIPKKDLGGKVVVLVDDVVDSGGSMRQAADLMIAHGAIITGAMVIYMVGDKWQDDLPNKTAYARIVQ